jgi:hypothetical protein
MMTEEREGRVFTVRQNFDELEMLLNGVVVHSEMMAENYSEEEMVAMYIDHQLLCSESMPVVDSPRFKKLLDLSYDVQFTIEGPAFKEDCLRGRCETLFNPKIDSFREAR